MRKSVPFPRAAGLLAAFVAAVVLLASGCGGWGDVSVWDTATGQETLILKGHTSPIYSVAFSPDGKRLGKIEQSQGDETAAQAHFDESLRLCQELRQLEMLGRSLNLSASAAFRTGDFVKAALLFKELLELGEEL